MATTAAMTFIVVFAALKPVKALVTSEMEALLVYSLICTIICDVDMKQYFKQNTICCTLFAKGLGDLLAGPSQQNMLCFFFGAESITTAVLFQKCKKGS